MKEIERAVFWKIRMSKINDVSANPKTYSMKLYNIACDSHVSWLQDGVYFVLQMCSDKS